ncbi:MAG: dienelactone hydrolase family protein [Chloroflexi bacterium]|nr:dienelactone hydrolase family protein [Chloroflexota bacterium]
MRQQSIAFRGRGIALDGIVTLPQGAPGPFPGVVLCHSHPMFGESMASAVMQALAQALDSQRMATLRFNFRGVGGSEGTFDQGKGEQEDLKAALDTFRKWPGVDKNRLGVAGISFGAVVALDAIPKAKGILALALISPTASAVLRSRIGRFKGAKLILVGEQDHLAPPGELREAIGPLSPDVTFDVVAGADHAWRGCEDQMATLVAQFLVGALR